MGEAIIGDIAPSNGISKEISENKKLRERLAIQFLSALNRPGNPTFVIELESIWEEYEERKTKEAQLVRDIDIYERLVQAKEYEVRERGEKDLGDFFVQWEEMITTSEIRRWTKSLLAERETFWSRRKASAVIIFVLGGPGVGKGTQCARLARDLGFQHLSVGDLLREETHRLDSPFASFINESIQNSVIIPAQLTVNLLKVKISTSKLQGRSRFLIDGYPRNIDQAVMFEEEIQDSNPTVLLECSNDEMLRRLRKRAESSGRIDDNPDVFKKRLDTYQKESLPVVDYLRGKGTVRTFKIDRSSMELALQQWQLTHGIDDNAFQSLKAILTPSFLSNVSDGVEGQDGITSIAPISSHFWGPQADYIPLLASEYNQYTSGVSSVYNAGAAPPSNVIVSEPVENSAWVPLAAQKKNQPIACIKCWVEKKKCDPGTPWAEPSYESKLIWENLQCGDVIKSASLTHEEGGPALHVNCREFIANSPDQHQLFWKEATGWKYLHTTTYCLEKPNVDLASYLDEFSSIYLKKAGEKADYLSQIFRLAGLYPDVCFLLAAASKESQLMYPSEPNNTPCIATMDC
ncbi:MAG: hypothetical protein Q9167_002356 [Letrouitia subvulpina]